jgi:hypothetical protein
MGSRSYVYPFGLPLRIQCHDARLHAQIMAALQHWDALPASEHSQQTALTIELIVRATDVAPPLQPPQIQHQAGTTVLAAYGDTLWTVQQDRGYALVVLHPDLVAHPPTLLREVFTPLVHALVAPHDRHLLPATTLLWHGHALVLVPVAGADVVALIVAAQQAGFQILSSPHSICSLHEELRLWAALCTTDQPAQLSTAHVTLCLVEPGHGRASEAAAVPSSALAGQPPLHVLAELPAPLSTLRMQLGRDLTSAVSLLRYLITAERRVAT